MVRRKRNRAPQKAVLPARYTMSTLHRELGRYAGGALFETDVKLELENPDASAELASRVPQLRDTILVLLTSKMRHRSELPGQVPVAR